MAAAILMKLFSAQAHYNGFRKPSPRFGELPSPLKMTTTGLHQRFQWLIPGVLKKNYVSLNSKMYRMPILPVASNRFNL